jgi:hypothetical protein
VATPFTDALLGLARLRAQQLGLYERGAQGSPAAPARPPASHPSSA